MLNRYSIIFHYLFYNFIQLFFLMAVVSVFTSIHFFMDHNFSVTESWLSENGWYHLIFVKLIAFISYLYFSRIQSYKKSSHFFRSILTSERVTRHPFILAIVGYFVFTYFAKMQDYSVQVQHLFNFFISITCMTIHFSLDYLFIKSFSENKKVSFLQEVLLSSIFSMFFFFITNSHYQLKYVIVLNIIFLSLNKIELLKNYLSYALLLFLFISPMLIVIGADPFLNYTGIFKGTPLNIPYWSIIIFLLTIFLYDFHSKKALRTINGI